MTAWLRRHPLAGFYGLAYAFTWAIGVPLLFSRRGWISVELPHALEAAAAFGPGVAAVIVLGAIRGREGVSELLHSLVHWRTRPLWLAAALLSPVGMLLLALAGAGATGGETASHSSGLTELWTFTGLFELVVVGGLVQSLGEEPGWRGFAIPTLRERLGPLAATLALWPVWLCWHLPFFLSRPAFGWAQLAGFAIGILSAAIWLTLIRDHTQSLLMCVGWHAMANICRNTALAGSTAAFLVYNNLVLLTAMIIAGSWLVRSRKPLRSANG